MRIPYISMLAASALALGGCAYNGLGFGIGSPYYSSSYESPYYGDYGCGGYGGYGYSPYSGGYGGYGQGSGISISIGSGSPYGYGSSPYSGCSNYYPGYGYYGPRWR